MAGSKSRYLEVAILDHILGNTIWTPPSVIYVALSSTVFDDTDTGSDFDEITTAGAARVAVANNATNWPSASSSNLKTNGTTITFPAATNTWPEARSFYLLDALSGGNVLYGGDLLTPRTLQAGDTASFGPGSIQILED